LQAAMRLRRPELVATAAAITEQLPTTGRMTRIQRRHAAAAVAAVRGDVAGALAEFAAVNRDLVELGERYTAAAHMLDVAALLPEEPAARALAEAWRRLLEELEASVDLAFLDSLPPLAATPGPVAAAAPMQEGATATGS
ncbi:hypothetical protein B0B28_30655, partial [Pseudomonas aeruginosa]|uniref:hypothetical protein n=1 Tax=Pseudomonas aeruginosa TaxID=287 RepID=UPI0009D40C5D